MLLPSSHDDHRSPDNAAGVAVATVDKLGRRPLLLAGVSGLVLSLIALGSAQYLEKGSVSTWTSVAALLAYTASYQVSSAAQHAKHAI